MSTAAIYQSDQIETLAEALAAAQAEMGPAAKNGVNSFLGSQYADMNSVREACVPALSKHGLAVTQIVVERAEPLFFERVVVEKDKDKNPITVSITAQVLGLLRTELIHVSGQWIASDFPIACDWGDPQELGAVISHLKRYALQAIVCVAQESAAPAQQPARRWEGQGRRDDRRPSPAPAAAPKKATPPAPAAPAARLDPPWEEVDDPSIDAHLDAIAAELPRPPAVSRVEPAPVMEAPASGSEVNGVFLHNWLEVDCPDRELPPAMRAWGIGQGWPAEVVDWSPKQATAAFTHATKRLAKARQAANGQPVGSAL